VAGAIAELAKRAADSMTNLITIPPVRRLCPHGMLQRVLGSRKLIAI
jgi:histone H3/H4